MVPHARRPSPTFRRQRLSHVVTTCTRCPPHRRATRRAGRVTGRARHPTACTSATRSFSPTPRHPSAGRSSRSAGHSSRSQRSSTPPCRLRDVACPGTPSAAVRGPRAASLERPRGICRPRHLTPHGIDHLAAPVETAAASASRVRLDARAHCGVRPRTRRYARRCGRRRVRHRAPPAPRRSHGARRSSGSARSSSRAGC